MCRLPDKILTKFLPIFAELWPFENFGILNLSVRYLEKYMGLELETLSADRG